MQPEQEQPTNAFAALVRPDDAPLLRQTLRAPGTWLTDIEIHQLFYRMATRKQWHTPRDLNFVDSCVMAAALAPSVRDDAPIKRHLRDYFAQGESPLVLVPLVCGSHWSLLVYRSRAQAWYHLDSLAPYHTQLAHQTVARLSRAGAVPGRRTRGGVTPIVMPRQREGWECGLYLLQYALLVIRASREAGPSHERTFYRRLCEYDDIACDENLVLFTEQLLKIV